MSLATIQNKECEACKFCSSPNVCQINADFDVDNDVLMVVGDFPSKRDSDNDTIFQSGKESFFWEIALSCIEGARRFQFYPTYAVKCRTVAGDTPTKAEIEACKHYLREEIKLLKPKAILLLGAIPMLSLGIKGAITKERGAVQEIDIDGFKTKAIATYAPMYVVNNRGVFDNFARDINKAYTIATGTEEEVEETKVVYVDTIEGVQQVIDYCLQTKEVCVDFETTEIEELGTFAPGFKATLMSLSFQHGSSYAIPLEHFESPFTKQEVLQILGMVSRELFQNPNIRKINHNIKYEMHVMAHYGYPIWRGRIDDTMLMHHLLDSEASHKLKEILPTYYPSREGYQHEVNKYKWAEVPLKVLVPYGATDTDLTFRLCTILEAQLLKDQREYAIYRNQIIPALTPLFRAERRGMQVSRPAIIANIQRAKFLKGEQEKVLLAYPQIKKFEVAERARRIKKAIADLEIERQEKFEAASVKIDERIKNLESKLEEKKGKALEKQVALIHEVRSTKSEKLNEIIQRYSDKINAVRTGQEVVYEGVEVSNPNHIAEFMYSKEGLGYPLFYVRSDRKYKKTTDQRYIKRYNDHTGFIKDLLILRSINTNINTFMVGMLEHLDPSDIVHTNFMQAVTATGRLASQKPNLQQIPKHIKVNSPYVEEVVSMITKVFTVPAGYTLVSGDFSQAELRIIAELAGETAMIEAYNNGIDLHALTASIVLGKTLEEFYQMPEKERKEWRQKAKACNFGLIFGQEPLGFMEYAESSYGVKMSLQEATIIRDKFFRAYPKLLDYHLECELKGKKYGYVRSLLGRKRHVRNINHSDEYVAGDDVRAAINHPVQATCGEMTILAFALLEHRLPKSVLFVNTIHDNIIYYCPNHLVPYATKVMRDTAENLPTKFLFGRELEKVKLLMDIEASTTNWKELAPYKEEDWKEFVSKKEIDSYYAFIDQKKKITA